MHGELLGGTRDTVVVEDGVDQGRRAVGVIVEQSLYRGGRRSVVQRRHGRRFVANDLRRRWTYRRAIPDLRMDLRGRRRRADASLTAEQLIRRGLIVDALVAVVIDVLMMVAAVLVVVQCFGLARVDLRERRLRLIVLRITGRMLEGTARDGGGRLAGPGRSCRTKGGRGRAGSRRGCSRLMILHLVIRKIILVVIVAIIVVLV